MVLGPLVRVQVVSVVSASNCASVSTMRAYLPVCAAYHEWSCASGTVAETVTLTATSALEARTPSQAVTVNAVVVPVKLVAGIHTSDSPDERIVTPGVTATALFVKVPALTASIRKLGKVPSGSLSFAAAPRVV